MAETIAGPLGELRGSTSTGVALTTAAAFTAIPKGTRLLQLSPRNFVGAAVVRVAVNPYLTVLKTADALATAPTDYSENAQDGDAGTDVTLSSLDTAANLDFLYVGSHLPFRGVNIDVDAANGTVNAITVKYRKSDDTWADISATDGTDSGGASMAIDGNVTWTVPTDWKSARLIDIGDTILSFPGATSYLYWTRWQWSAAMDSSTTLNAMLAMSRSTAYAELASGQALEFGVMKGPDGLGCIEALTDAGTANLVMNFAAIGGRF